MDNSNRQSHRIGITPFIILMMITECIIACCFFVGILDGVEFRQIATGIPIIFAMIMPFLYFHKERKQRRSSMRVVLEESTNGGMTLSIYAKIQSVMPFLEFSLLLLCLIIWRWHVDELFVRKVLCMCFFGLTSLVFLLVGWSFYVTKIHFSFYPDRLQITWTTRLGFSKRMLSMSYGNAPSIRCIQTDEHISGLAITDSYSKHNEIIGCSLSPEQGRMVCTYCEEQIEDHRKRLIQAEKDRGASRN